MAPSDNIDQLTQFWHAAALPVPLIVVGGGRWGRTWLSVINRARGSCRGLVMVARSNPDDLRAWVTGREELVGIQIAESLDEAVMMQPGAVAAIVTSRPRDHMQDGLAALQRGLHVLVEKPLGETERAGRTLLSAAAGAGRILGVGTEFAFLPALHQCAAELALKTAGATKLCLEWHDPAQELRHGALKVRHDEIGLLVDLLSHAVSIFQIFAPGAVFRVAGATQNPDGTEGYLHLDVAGGRYELACSSAAGKRVRLLTIESGATRASIDFSAEEPTIVTDGKSLLLSEEFSALSSTLRLELGAFLMNVTGMGPATFISTGAETLVSLQGQLERRLQS